MEAASREEISMVLAADSGRYLKAFDRRAHGYALLGHTNEEIAELLGIDPSVLDTWMVEHPSLAAAIRKARVDDMVRVIKSAHRAANGFRHKETKLHVVGKTIKKTDVTKVYPPNVAAINLLATNRLPKLWRDSKLVDQGGQVDLLAAIREAMGENAKVINGSAETVAGEPKPLPVVSDQGDDSVSE